MIGKLKIMNATNIIKRVVVKTRGCRLKVPDSASMVMRTTHNENYRVFVMARRSCVYGSQTD